MDEETDLLDQIDEFPIGGPVAPPAPPPPATIMDRAVCLVVTRGKFGNRRKTSVDRLMDIAVEEAGSSPPISTTMTDKVDRTLLSASKRLLDSDELKRISQLDGEVASYLSKIALPSMFKSGVHLIPIPMVESVEAALRSFRDRREALVAKFVLVYPAQVKEVERKLGDLFSPLDYPDISRLPTFFEFSWMYVTFGVPGSLKSIKASLFEDEKAKYAKKLEDATDACRQAMRAGLAEVVEKMVERLEPDESGDEGPKRKIFKASTVENLNQFLATFDMRNVTDDAELAALASKARSLMVGVDPKLLRDDNLIRQQVQAGFAAIAATLETMGIDRQSRQIDFEL